MITLATKCRTAFALGAGNLARVAAYRVALRYGWHRVRRVRAAAPRGPFFANANAGAGEALPLPPADQWGDSALWFGRWPVALGAAAPDWHANPLTGARVAAAANPWWQIPDFAPALGDIKPVWEASRFAWVLAYAQRARAGQAGALERLNAWLDDWCSRNRPYCGPNWKCGQEASIRVMHLAMAALVLGPAGAPAAATAMPGLRALLLVHLRRIAPTIGYAIGQDNNHGTSEAAALFIGGSWLHALGEPAGAQWQQAGRRLLEERAVRLIGADGSFSQYSLNYHRMLLDTLSMAELWRRRLALAPFAPPLRARAAAAAGWLFHLIDDVSGDGPNVGANDGAHLLQLGASRYRDYRPSVQLASVLFEQARAYAADGAWNDALRALGVDLPAQVRTAAGSRIFDDGGFAVLRRDGAMAMLRYPRFRFRPSQADALHLDLWLDGVNLLRDAGSYSYHAQPDQSPYFSGTQAHNTVQFDQRDQMPRWSRFLFANWLETRNVEPLSHGAQGESFGASYRGEAGETHARSIELEAGRLQVRDRIAGFTESAVLRWRLAPGDWRIEGHAVSRGGHTLRIGASMPIVRFEIVTGWESRHYLEKTPLPVLEIEVRAPGELTSEYRWLR